MRSPYSADELCIQGDVGLQQLGNRATSLGLVGKLVELGLIRTRYLGLQVQMHGGDGEPVRDLLESNLSGCLHPFRSEFGLAQYERQRHREAAGVGRADEFFWVGARLALETAAEAVRIVLQRTALGRDRALAILEAALPDGRSVGFHSQFSLNCFVAQTFPQLVSSSTVMALRFTDRSMHPGQAKNSLSAVLRQAKFYLRVDRTCGRTGR